MDQLDCLDLQLSGVNRHPHVGPSMSLLVASRSKKTRNILVVAIKSTKATFTSFFLSGLNCVLQNTFCQTFPPLQHCSSFPIARLENSVRQPSLTADHPSSPGPKRPKRRLYSLCQPSPILVFGLVVSALPPSLYSWSDPQLLVPLISDWTDPHPSSRTLSRPAIHSKTPAVHHPDHPPPWSCLAVPG
ncbi:hypothetical protein PGTUg99_003714 [Puccinia graminis f. sp. tritici]|uniref:Uncharacterized protein n=1 Tax=Puccinia graminis f. sp. tritici TaxID=56615 RepID=A0A5B0SBG1_PUCGR|nr:hypothetical protein PGTUg99_003714 [Puccinia graminis f. sp. tritici]